VYLHEKHYINLIILAIYLQMTKTIFLIRKQNHITEVQYKNLIQSIYHKLRNTILL